MTLSHEALAKALDEFGDLELIDSVGIAVIQIAESSDETTTYVHVHTLQNRFVN